MDNLVSVIIPCKNGAKYLEETLKGIAVNEGVNFEIILIDDGSDDNTSEIAKSYGCNVIRNEVSQGPVKAKNQALKIAKGSFILFHDSDDILNDGAIARLLDEFTPDIMAVEAKVKDFLSPDCDDKTTVVKPEPYWGLFTGAILIRKEVFDIIGGFDESVTAGEILDWQNKMDKNNLKVKKIDFITTNRRLHSSNFGKTQKGVEYKSYAALLRARITGKMSKEDLTKNVTSMFRTNSFIDDRKKLSDDEHKKNIENLLKNLDSDALEHAKNLTDKLEKTYNSNFVPIEEVYSKEELKQLHIVKDFENSVEKTENGYRWGKFTLPIKLFESSVFYYRHGLDRLKTKEKVGNKAIIDAGCFIADSVLVFRDEFKNSPIYGFEPLCSNYELALKTVELNNLKNVKIENYGLGDKKDLQKIKTFDTNLKNIESIICPEGDTEVKITTIDDYVKENNLTVGLIKTDVEGFEQKLLKGARKTISEQKPILLISIYHNYDDFYKIKPLLESWDLGYEFDFFQGVQNAGNIVVESMLLAENYGKQTI